MRPEVVAAMIAMIVVFCIFCVQVIRIKINVLTKPGMPVDKSFVDRWIARRIVVYVVGREVYARGPLRATIHVATGKDATHAMRIARCRVEGTARWVIEKPYKEHECTFRVRDQAKAYEQSTWR